MIRKNISNDIAEELSNLKKELQIYLNHNFDVSQTKLFLQTHIPKEIIYKSEVLLDTQLNYLMDDARNKIKSADIKLQNAFFDADFRKRTHNWVKQQGNKFLLDPDLVLYSSDVRQKYGVVASGVTFVVGSSISLALAPSFIGTIIAGLITIILSAFSFKLAFNHVTPKAREIIKLDIDKYLDESKKQIFDWLKKVEIRFNADFRNFCSTNGFSFEGNANE